MKSKIHVQRHRRDIYTPKGRIKKNIGKVFGYSQRDESGNESSWSPQDTYSEGQSYAPKGYDFVGITDNEYDASLFKKQNPKRSKSFRYTDDTWFLYRKKKLFPGEKGIVGELV